MEKKNLTVIRGRLLDRHPELPQREFDQDLVRSRFRVLFRKTAFMVVNKRNQLLKQNP